jgi:predicted component of type VI protein secretion system
MPWDKRGYYYRKKRIGARVVSEYVGRGFPGQLAAGEDEMARNERAQAQASTQAAQQKAEALDQNIAAADELISAAMNEALEAAGYHRHARGQWRKRRDTKSD